MSMNYDFDRIDSLIETGMYSEALDLLTGILEEEPDNQEALWRIGVVFTERNEPFKARKALQYFFRFQEEHPQALEAYGCALFKMGQNQQACEYLEKAEKIMPGSSSIKRNLGVVYNQLGKRDTSYSKFKKSYDMNPEDYRTGYALAMAHIHFNHYAAAREVLERMLSQQLPTDFRELADESYKWIKKRLGHHIDRD
ncbi:MAG: tetratricopeptide repeat protein [bacterium]